MSLNFTEELNRLSEKINKRGINNPTPKQDDKDTTTTTTTGDNKQKPQTSYDITIEEPEKFIPVDSGIYQRLSRFSNNIGVLLKSMLADFVDIVGYYDPTMKDRGSDIMLYARFRTMSDQEYQYLEEKGDGRPRMIISSFVNEDTTTSEEKEIFDAVKSLCKSSNDNNFDYSKYVKLSSEGKKILSSIVWFADQKKKKYVLNDNPGTPKFAMSNLGNYYFKPEPTPNAQFPGVFGNSTNIYAYVLLDPTIIAKKTFVASDDKEANRKYMFKVYNIADTRNGDKVIKIVRINKDVNMGYYNDGICMVY